MPAPEHYLAGSSSVGPEDSSPEAKLGQHFAGSPSLALEDWPQEAKTESATQMVLEDSWIELGQRRRLLLPRSAPSRSSKPR